ncbi:hypothetical protein CesoFtcFv8_020795 [Champsocephalus esox]|uniref:Uncharacterized protein n=1 Tax=Champsocephalus esox TaxID=159716 RepID=A0AAN8BCI5_9TELE|nr:hypothetical protein CesoFtcFv8_020795 [Champsocephalus esox]
MCFCGLEDCVEASLEAAGTHLELGNRGLPALSQRGEGGGCQAARFFFLDGWPNFWVGCAWAAAGTGDFLGQLALVSCLGWGLGAGCHLCCFGTLNRAEFKAAWAKD